VALWIHPHDAAELGIGSGDLIALQSRHGDIEVPAEIRDEVRRGAVSLPRGWGHRGRWQLANRHAGANFNVLTKAGVGALESISGMAHLTGVHVRIEPVLRPPDARAATASAVA
jgi:formate dehydrogenase